MNKLQISFIIMLLSASSMAFANHDGMMGDHCKMHGKKMFEEADTDKDGTLDKEEAKSLMKMDFDKMDADHDGTISQDEFNTCGHHAHGDKASKLHEKRSKQFSAADADNDGTLTKEEAVKLPKVSKNFDAIDVDKDGTVDRDEVHNFMHTNKAK